MARKYDIAKELEEIQTNAQEWLQEARESGEYPQEALEDFSIQIDGRVKDAQKQLLEVYSNDFDMVMDPSYSDDDVDGWCMGGHAYDDDLEEKYGAVPFDDFVEAVVEAYEKYKAKGRKEYDESVRTELWKIMGEPTRSLRKEYEYDACVEYWRQTGTLYSE
jgi:hypothetical protein